MYVYNLFIGNIYKAFLEGHYSGALSTPARLYRNEVFR